MRFTYDINGALEVEATVQSTREVFKTVFSNDSGLDEKELANGSNSFRRSSSRPGTSRKSRIDRAGRTHLCRGAGTRPADHRRGLMQFTAEIEDQRLRDIEAVRDEFRAFLNQFDKFVFNRD